MARIDRYVEALLQKKAERLLLVSGERATLVSAGRSQPLTATMPSVKLLDAMLQEIVPGPLADEVGQDGQHAFPYSAPAGPVTVNVRRSPGSLALEVLPKSNGAAGAPRPADETSAGAAPQAATPPPPSAEPAAEETGEAPAETMMLEPTSYAEQASAPSVAEAAPAASEAPRTPTAAPAEATEAAESIVSGPGTAAMDALLHEMVREGCSDLHLSAGCPPFFRKDGTIVMLSQREPLDPRRVQQLLYSITPPQRRAEFEECHDSDFSYEISELGRFRCNLFVDRKGSGGVFRVIPAEILTAEKLGLSKAILDLCHLSKGLVVVTGPTGSGKSTTLAAMIDYINRNRADHIITIEDPIEFVHPNKKCLINQREIGNHTAGFKAALRAALREDPDIVLVGEMRDLETVEIAIETAETGHLVFGTLHTNTAPSTVDRIIDQFPTDRQSQVRTMLSESLRGVIAQTLCKKKGGGRVAALEILLVNAAVSNLIREGKTFQLPSIMQTGKKLGMVTLNDALMGLVEKGLVEPEEAFVRSVARGELRSLLKAKGITVAVGPEPE